MMTDDLRDARPEGSPPRGPPGWSTRLRKDQVEGLEGTIASIANLGTHRDIRQSGALKRHATNLLVDCSLGELRLSSARSWRTGSRMAAHLRSDPSRSASEPAYSGALHNSAQALMAGYSKEKRGRVCPPPWRRRTGCQTADSRLRADTCSNDLRRVIVASCRPRE